MTRKHKIMIAAVILSIFAGVFAVAAFTKQNKPPDSNGVSGLNSFLEERLEFRLERLETIMSAMQKALETGIKAMLRLSDDIGEMADRILEMAGEIGEMADRIVETMELMSETLLELADCKNGASGDSKTTLILSPSEGKTLTDTTVFELAGGNDDFILYASSNAGMANPTNILVRDNLLAAAFSRIKNHTNSNKVYVAVKSVDNSTVGGLSNTVMLYVP